MKEINFKHLLAFFFVLVFLNIFYFYTKLYYPNSNTYHSDGLGALNAFFVVLLIRKLSETFSNYLFYILSISLIVWAVIFSEKVSQEYRIYSNFYYSLVFTFFAGVFMFIYSDIKIYLNKK